MSRRRLGLALVLIVVYALCYSAIKAGLAYAPPIRFAALRATLGGIALLVVIALARRPLLPPQQAYVGTMALAVIGAFLEYGAMFLSPGRPGAGISSVLGNSGPLMVILLAALFLHEPITWGKLTALLVGGVGVALIAYPAIVDPARPGLLGAALPLVAAAGAAGRSVLLKRMDVGDALLRVAAWQLLLGAVPLFVVSGALGEEGIRWTGAFLLTLSFLGLIGTGFALSLWYWLVQREDVGRLSLLLFLVPVVGLGLAAGFFDERIESIELIGVALTLGGVGLAMLRSRSGAAEVAARGRPHGDPTMQG